MVNQSPLISIITACYNSEKFIGETIRSVLSQTYTNWELIIVDDCSSDNSVTIIETFSHTNSSIKLIKNTSNKGVAVARNTATKAAKGQYIAFLDSDDVWKPHKLQTQINFMVENNYNVCYSSYELIDEKGNILNKTINALPELSLKKLLKSNYVGNLTGMYNTSKLGKIYVKNLRKRQDWLLWIEALKRSKKPAKGIQESLAFYRVRENSMSSNKFNLLKYNYWVYKKGLEFSTLKSIACMIQFLLEHFFVKSKQEVTSQKI